jgi:hypothetical protein
MGILRAGTPYIYKSVSLGEVDTSPGGFLAGYRGARRSLT